MKKSRLFRWGLLLCVAILSLNSCTFGDDEKDVEIVDDPLADTEEYYISGTVFDTETSAALAGVTVKAGDLSVTTNGEGKYDMVVKSKKEYQLEFSKDKYLTVNTTATIASSAAKRSMVVLGVKMKQKAQEVTVTKEGKTVTDKGTEDEANATIEVPAGAVDADCKISITPYEDAVGASTTTNAGKEEIPVSLQNLDIAVSGKTDDFKEKLTVTVKNLTPAEVGFKAESVEIWSKNSATRLDNSWTKESQITVKWNNGNYSFETNKLKSKYSLTIYTTRQTGAENKSEYNLVNGKTEFKVDNSGNNNAIKDIDIKIEAKAGWDFTVTPTAALTAVGVTGNDLTQMAEKIKEIIENQEGGIAKYYTVTHNLKANVSGNHIMYYKSRAKFCEKQYTFDIVVKGNKNAQITVKVKAYTGMEEVYQNEEATQHSGGKV